MRILNPLSSTGPVAIFNLGAMAAVLKKCNDHQAGLLQLCDTQSVKVNIIKLVTHNSNQLLATDYACLNNFYSTLWYTHTVTSVCCGKCHEIQKHIYQNQILWGISHMQGTGFGSYWMTLKVTASQHTFGITSMVYNPFTTTDKDMNFLNM